MAKFDFDIKNFSHVSSDKDCTVLRNKQGHEIKVMRKALKGDLKTQLEALAKAHIEKSQESDKLSDDELRQAYARGGHVDEIEETETTEVAPVSPTRAPVVAQQTEEVYKGPEFLRSEPGQAPIDKIKAGIKSLGDKLTSAQPVAVQEAMKSQGAGLAAPSKPVEPVEPQSVTANLAETPKSVNEAEVSAMGLATPETMQMGGLQQQLAGMEIEAQAKQQLAKESELQRKQFEDDQREVMQTYQNSAQELEGERQALLEDIRNNQIDPEKYWTGDKDGNGGHSKIAAAIGIIMAGFNPTNNPNAAIKFLENQMERNLKAQQANLNSKENLLRANLQQFGNLRDATQMTRVMQNDMMANRLEIAASKAQVPMAQAQLMQAAGKLKADAAKGMADLANKRAIAQLTAQANNNPEKGDAILAALDQVDPDRAKDLRSRYVPGMGFATSTEGAKATRETASMVDTATTELDKLEKIIGRTGKSVNLKTRAEAETIRQALIGALRVPITGPGAMNDGERTMLEGLIPDVTATMSLDSVNKTKLNTLRERLNSQARKTAQFNGIKNVKMFEPKEEIAEKTINGQTVRFKKVSGGWQRVK